MGICEQRDHLEKTTDNGTTGALDHGTMGPRDHSSGKRECFYHGV